MNKTTKVLSLAVAMFALVGLVTFPAAHADIIYHKEGCTPGFYKANAKKNEADQWPTISFEKNAITTTSSLSSVGINSHLVSQDTTLIDALNFRGGSSDTQAEQIFLRAAVAAFLNANNPNVNYLIPGDAILSVINGAHDLAVGEVLADFRTIILHFAGVLDHINNGPDDFEGKFCPLSNNGK